jgi:hypothetical protein
MFIFSSPFFLPRIEAGLAETLRPGVHTRWIAEAPWRAFAQAFQKP